MCKHAANAIYRQLHFPTATPFPWPNVCWTPRAGKLMATPRLWPKATPPGWALALDKAPALVWPFGPMDPVPTPPAVPPPVPAIFFLIKSNKSWLSYTVPKWQEMYFFGSAHPQLFYKILLSKRTMDLLEQFLYVLYAQLFVLHYTSNFPDRWRK